MATSRDEDVGDERAMSKGEGRVGVEVSNRKKKDYKKANREQCCSSLSKIYEAAASTSPLTRQPQCFSRSTGPRACVLTYVRLCFRGDTYQTYYVHKYFYIRVGTYHHTLRVKQATSSIIQYYLECYTERRVYRQKLRARLPNVFVRSTETVPREMFARPPKANAQHNILFIREQQQVSTISNDPYTHVRSDT